MRIVLRVIGVYLLVIGTLTLGSLFFIDLATLRSPEMVTLRHLLMVAAGVGFVLLRKWGVVIFFASFVINWIAYFTVYDGQGATTSLWMTVPVPLCIGIVSYLGWDRLRWSAARGDDEALGD